jgi:hypothetical protein
LVAEAVGTHTDDNPDSAHLLREVTARSAQLSSITRIKLSQMGCAVGLK